VITKADIPPGGEGEISVTFKTANRKGQQNKTIKVDSNDPSSPSTTLRIAAFVEIGFDFEGTSLRFGKMGRDEVLVKNANLVVQDPGKTKIVDISTSNPLVKARQEGEPVKTGDQYKVNISVTVGPGLPIGKLQEKVIIRSSDSENPEATLDLYGVIIDNIEVTPDSLNFLVDDSRKFTNQKSQTITIVNYIKSSPINILEAVDSGDNLTIDVKTIEPGQRFLVMATIKDDAFGDKLQLGGSIRIKTDSKEYGEFVVNYGALHVH